MYTGIKKVCVIGSGVMGAGIAALIASSSLEVILLDIVDTKVNDRNALVKKAISNIQVQKPAPLSHPKKLDFIRIGNLEDDLELIRDCDLVVEVIVENLDVKQSLYKKLLPFLNKDAVIASNTSTIRLEKLKNGLPQNVQSRFVITHFFNPPSYMDLVELVVSDSTNPQIVDRVTSFLTDSLGKSVVKCNDTPGFIANRIGCFFLELAVARAIEKGLNPALVDQICASLFKLPSTGIFGLYDLIGHDVIELISKSLVSNLNPGDGYNKLHATKPEALLRMIKDGLIGRKKGAGFYRMKATDSGKVKEVINLENFSYSEVLKQDLQFSSIEDLLAGDSAYSLFFAEVLTEFGLYVCSIVPSVTKNIYDIDLAMKLGYNWKYGPFELFLRMIPGKFSWLLEQAEKRKLSIPSYMSNKEYENIDLSKFEESKALPKPGRVVKQNDSAEFYHDDNKVIFCILTKMNSINSGVFTKLLSAIDYAESKGCDLYIHSKIKHFSVGADLRFIYSLVEAKNFKALDAFLKQGQDTMNRMKYSSVNVVSCAAGSALGGGCELLLHSDFIVAHTHLQAGLVEFSLGLIPAFGGTKEMFVRGAGNKNLLVQNLKNIIIANKSSSADYFFEDYGIKGSVIMNKHNLLESAYKLDLPRKANAVVSEINVPQINLAEELKHINYNAQQESMIENFQALIDRNTLSEDLLLEFERAKFLELIRIPSALDALKKFL